MPNNKLNNSVAELPLETVPLMKVLLSLQLKKSLPHSEKP
jgi:hypothetical protein